MVFNLQWIRTRLTGILPVRLLSAHGALAMNLALTRNALIAFIVAALLSGAMSDDDLTVADPPRLLTDMSQGVVVEGKIMLRLEIGMIGLGELDRPLLTSTAMFQATLWNHPQ